MRPELTKDIQETSIYVLNRPKSFLCLQFNLRPTSRG